MVATDIQTIQGASRAGLAASFTCIYLCCHLSSKAVKVLLLTHHDSHFGLSKQQM